MRVFRYAAPFALLSACGSSTHPPSVNLDSDGGPGDRGGGGVEATGGGSGDAGGDAAAVGESMVLIAANGAAGTLDFYIDSYEASLLGSAAVSVAGVDPAVNIDYMGAKAACAAAGKRLCTLQEWKVACRGPKDLLFSFQADAANLIARCDVARTTNNTPGSLPSKTGAHPQCKTDGYEVFDMIGNLTEWADSTTPVAAGAAFYQPEVGSTCEATLNEPGTVTPMPPTEKATDIGFRCCRTK